MMKDTYCKLALLPLVMLAALAFAFPTRSPAAESDAEGLRAREELASLLEDLATIETIHLRASAVVLRQSESGKTLRGDARYSLDLDGKRYRVAASTDPALGLLSKFAWAFDGSISYFLTPSQGVLTISSQRRTETPVAIPNPLFLEFSFLRSGGARVCATCTADLSWLTEAEFPADRLREARLVPAESGSGPMAVELEFASTSPDGEGGSVVVRLEGRAGHRMPARIEWRDAEGRLRGLVTIRPSAPARATSEFPRPLPAKVRFQVFAPNERGQSGALMDIEYAIEELEINGEIDPARFRIEATPEMSIWDEEREAFVGASPPSPHRSPPSAASS